MPQPARATPRTGTASLPPRHPDHRRRHRRLQGARPDPAPEGARHPRPLRADQGRAAIRHAAGRRRAGGRALLHGSVRCPERVRRRAYPPRARLRPDHRRARDRRPDGEDGAGPCRRSRQRHPARDQPAGAAGAGDEPADVDQCRDPAQRRAAPPRRRRLDRPECRRDGRSQRSRRRPHGRADRDRRRRRAMLRPPHRARWPASAC